MNTIFNPYGEEITVKTDGQYFKSEGRDVDYFSQFQEGVVAAFIEDIQEEEIFCNARDSLNYKSVYSEAITKKNNGKKSFIIINSKDYLS